MVVEKNDDQRCIGDDGDVAEEEEDGDDAANVGPRRESRTGTRKR
jgi:hypothetical protein